MKGSFQFRINGEDCRVEGAPVNMTLLEYLRKRGLNGAKDACGEGGCGACTVAVMERTTEGEATFRSILSCVTLLPTLANREIITVEGLCRNGDLHPAQQALEGQGGALCGYCTPGVVMSLFEGYYRKDLRKRWQVEEQLAGNICRCSGYRAIQTAGEECFQAGQRVALAAKSGGGKSGEGRPRDVFSEALHQSSVRLEECEYIDSSEGRFYRPVTLAELMKMRARYTAARLLGGGIGTALARTRDGAQFRCLISLDGIPELRTIHRHQDYWEIGAGASLTDLMDSVEGEYLPLDEVIVQLGSRQIRNRASLGGCLVSPGLSGELGVVLVALKASLRLYSSEGERELSVEKFYSDAGEPDLHGSEIIKEVRLPRYPPEQLESRGVESRMGRAYKVSKRRHLDDAIVVGCFVVELENGRRIQTARIVYGGVAPKPVRARRTESFLEGKTWDWSSIAGALAILRGEFDTVEDELASAEYRAALVINLFEKFYREFADGRKVPAALGMETGKLRDERLLLAESNAGNSGSERLPVE